MMTLITQDGRKIELHRWDNPCFVTVRFNDHYNEISCTPRDEHDKPLNRLGQIVARYFNKAKARALVAELEAAWESGATEFTMPADTDPDPVEELEKFADKHKLTLCSINEVGYTRADEIRNRRIWETTDEFERHNIIISDGYGSFERSLAKWRALQPKATA